MATAYATICSDAERMLSFKEPTATAKSDIPGEYTQAEPDPGETEDQRVRVEDAYVGQLH